jgi:hypothetical protein
MKGASLTSYVVVQGTFEATATHHLLPLSLHIFF